MKAKWTIVMLFAMLGLGAQHTISGTFSPAEEFSWLIAYRLTPAAQSYIADTGIKDGKFEMKVPENAKPGIYRMVYAIPQEEFYFDIVFGNTEDVVLEFDLDQGVHFSTSEENKLFLSYFKEMDTLERDLISFYENDTDGKSVFKQRTATWKERQDYYEELTKNTFIHTFITANRGYFPERMETKQQYIKHKKVHYFDYLDFSDPDLQASDLLSEKAINYIFTGQATDSLTDREVFHTTIKENLAVLDTQLNGSSKAYRFSLFHKIWKRSAAQNLTRVSDHVLNTYLTPNAESKDDKETLNTIIADNRLRIGKKAPEIEWVSGEETKRLTTTTTDKYVVLIFWSSTCGHCLKEIPPLHEKLKTNTAATVIAVGLEEGEDTWKNQSAILPDFEHAIALGKWESTYAKVYDIQKTPTYFILDKEKRIVAKPENAKAVLAFLED
ncbi:TlpA family protein disulfide reductase [Maribacter sp. 2-571]|uniref:TlpA family protein disulfide reductase n=1 Tax=Maribacter sp. 2-571 TaxID=3417569 RepID=UPI003D358D53